MAGDGSRLPAPGKYLQNSLPPRHCWKETSCHAGAAAGAGRTLELCASAPSTAPSRDAAPHRNAALLHPPWACREQES